MLGGMETFRVLTALRVLSVWILVSCVLCPAFCRADDYKGWRKKHPKWKLVFSDDFKGKRLNTKKWNRVRYEPGNRADWRRYQSSDDELVTVNGNSTVSLWGKFGPYTSQNDPEGTAEGYACGGIFTDQSFAFQYGYVEVRAKFDSAQGAWPAIWLMPTDGSSWPAKGEIDIMEHLNSDNTVYQTIHYKNASGGRTSKALRQGAAVFDSARDREAFHTYGVEWTEEGVTFYMDGKVTGSCPTEENNPNWPFNMEDNPFYLLLDMQLGGSWVGRIDREAVGDGVAMTIDYVRVYADPRSVVRLSSDADREEKAGKDSKAGKTKATPRKKTTSKKTKRRSK